MNGGATVLASGFAGLEWGQSARTAALAIRQGLGEAPNTDPGVTNVAQWLDDAKRSPLVGVSSQRNAEGDLIARGD